MNGLEFKIGYDPFTPPKDMAGLDIQLWPSINDQIDVVLNHVESSKKILRHLKPTDREYDNIMRDMVFMSATLHTLGVVKDLLEGKPKG